MKKIEWIFVKELGYKYKISVYEHSQKENPDIEELPSGWFKQGDVVYNPAYVVAIKYY